ncbi:F-box protein, partial [Endozoicomonas sp. ALB122]
MNGIDNNPRIEVSHSPPKRAQLQTPEGNHADRRVRVPDQKRKDKPSLQFLSPLSLSMIFSYLELRDIRSIERTCTFLHEAVKEDKALAKAWYRQFPSPQQYQLRTAIKTKDATQLRDWLKSFTNNQTLLKSLTDLNPVGASVPAQLYFTRARLMSEYKIFNLVRKDTIHANECVDSAALSVDGRHLLIASFDYTAKIYRRMADGS